MVRSAYLTDCLKEIGNRHPRLHPTAYSYLKSIIVGSYLNHVNGGDYHTEIILGSVEVYKYGISTLVSSVGNYGIFCIAVNERYFLHSAFAGCKIGIIFTHVRKKKCVTLPVGAEYFYKCNLVISLHKRAYERSCKNVALARISCSTGHCLARFHKRHDFKSGFFGDLSEVYRHSRKLSFLYPTSYCKTVAHCSCVRFGIDGLYLIKCGKILFNLCCYVLILNLGSVFCKLALLGIYDLNSEALKHLGILNEEVAHTVKASANATCGRTVERRCRNSCTDVSGGLIDNVRVVYMSCRNCKCFAASVKHTAHIHNSVNSVAEAYFKLLKRRAHRVGLSGIENYDRKLGSRKRIYTLERGRVCRVPSNDSLASFSFKLCNGCRKFFFNTAEGNCENVEALSRKLVYKSIGKRLKTRTRLCAASAVIIKLDIKRQKAYFSLVHLFFLLV